MRSRENRHSEAIPSRCVGEAAAKVEAQAAAGPMGGLQGVQRDEVVGATMTTDITVALTEIVIIDDVAMVTVVAVVISDVFPLDNFAHVTLAVIRVSSVGIDVFNFITEDTCVIITYITPRVSAVSAAAVAVNVAVMLEIYCEVEE